MVSCSSMALALLVEELRGQLDPFGLQEQKAKKAKDPADVHAIIHRMSDLAHQQSDLAHKKNTKEAFRIAAKTHARVAGAALQHGMKDIFQRHATISKDFEKRGKEGVIGRLKKRMEPDKKRWGVHDD